MDEAKKKKEEKKEKKQRNQEEGKVEPKKAKCDSVIDFY